MRAIVFLLLAIAVTLLLGSSMAEVYSKTTQLQDMTVAARHEYVLALNRRRPHGMLTIHGLWPNPINCPAEPFDARKLAPIRAEMEKYWPSFKGVHDNEKFWKHEYDKHGSCFNSTQIGYFTKTIDLLLQYTKSCDQTQFTDCRCKLDSHFNLIEPCRQKN